MKKLMYCNTENLSKESRFLVGKFHSGTSLILTAVAVCAGWPLSVAQVRQTRSL
jgi:hypothetical protein